MGRPLRVLQPHTTWFVTTRCVGAKFLLRPDGAMSERAGFLLARAVARCQGISIQGVVVMSNHVHLIVVDHRAELSFFMEWLLGALAKAVNELRGRRGSVFERRFSAEPILDDDARTERLLYLTLNPVKARLVASHAQWPGLCLRSRTGDPEEHVFRQFRKAQFRQAECKARRAGAAPPARADFEDRAVLRLEPLQPDASRETRRAAARAFEEELLAREARLREERRAGGLALLGAQRVREQDPEDAPDSPKRSRRPLCHASVRELWYAFREALRDVRRAYTAASSQFRAGCWEVAFPLYTFRPVGALVLPT